MEILVPIVAILVILPFTFFLLAERDIFFTKMETGDIKFIVRGDSLQRIIHDVRGRKLEKDHQGHSTFVPGEEKRNFLNKRFGIWWVGIPPFAKIHSFKINPAHENPSATKSEEWIVSGKPKDVQTLRFTFPRPYKLDKVELTDRLSVDMLVVAKFEVVTPYTPVFLFKGNFFEISGSILRAHVADLVNNRTLDEFIPAPKGEVGGILESMKADEKDTRDDPMNPGHGFGDFNRELIRQVGLRLVGISITQYDPSDESIRKAIEAEQIAKKQGQAVIATAEAKATAEERLALARGARIRETVNAIVGTNGNPDIIAQQVGKVLQAEALTSENSKITTWVDGAGSQTVIPIGGNK